MCDTPTNGSSYSFFTLRLFWPPGILTTNGAASARAAAAAAAGNVSAGFWTHGLWPSAWSGSSRADRGAALNCGGGGDDDAASGSTAAINLTQQQQRLGLPAPLAAALAFYMPDPTAVRNTSVAGAFGAPAAAEPFWAYEYDKHGSCSGLQGGPSAYYSALVNASRAYAPRMLSALAAAGVTPSNDRQYAAGDVAAALAAAFGGSFSSGRSMLCATDSLGRVVLQEVQICLSREALRPCDCWSGPLARSRATAGDVLKSCASGAGGQLWFNAYVSGASAFTAPPLLWLWIVLGVLGGALAALGVAYCALVRAGKVPWLFAPKAKVVVVRNPLVTARDVVVSIEPVDMVQLRAHAPDLAAVIDDLPPGMAIKGGIARKVLKLAVGSPEPPGAFDVDVVVLLDERACGDGGNAAAAVGHDVNDGHGDDESDDDDVDEALRRAVREEVTGTRLGAMVLEAQDCEIATRRHLLSYFHTRDVSLNEVMILKHAPLRAQQQQQGAGAGAAAAAAATAAGDEEDANAAAAAAAVPHLYFSAEARSDAAAGLVRPSCHQLKGKLAAFWQLDDEGRPFVSPVYFARTLVRFLKGHAKDFAVDAATWAHYRRAKLDRVTLFRVLRPFHDDGGKLQAAVDQLIRAGLLSRLEVLRAGGVNSLWGLLLKEVNAIIAAHGGRLTLEPLGPEAVEQWVKLKEAQLAAKLLQQRLRARRTGFVPSDESAADRPGGVRLPPSLLEYVARGPTYACAAAAAATAAAAVPAALDAAAAPPAANALAAGKGKKKAAPAVVAAALAAANAAGSKQAAAEGGGSAVRWLRFSEAGTFVDPQRPSHCGSFYNVWQLADPERDAAGYEPLVGDEDVKQKGHVPASRLALFVLSCMRPAAWWLACAYAALLVGAAAQLYLPLVQGNIFNGITGANAPVLAQSMAIYVSLSGVSLLSMLLGSVLLERAAGVTLPRLYGSLYEHLMAQSGAFLSGVSTGELMSRTSGDAMVLYGLVTTTTYRVVEGAVLAFGSLGFLIGLFDKPYTGPRVFQWLVAVSFVLSVVEAAVLSIWGVRPVNLALRQSMGRMFGFTLDTFSNAATVASLGLRLFLAADYKRFSEDNFGCFHRNNVIAIAHRTFTSAMSTGLYVAALWIGAGQVLAGYDTVGGLVAILRYLRLMGRGVKAASDAAVRWAASLGSLERLVQLHDRGVLAAAAAAAATAAPAAAAAVPDEPEAAAALAGGSGGGKGGGGGGGEPLCLSGGVALARAGLTLSTRTGNVVLRGLEFRVEPGEVVLVQGEHGSGKTLLLEVLLLQHPLATGDVLVQAAAAPPASSALPPPLPPPGGNGQQGQEQQEKQEQQREWRWRPVRLLSPDGGGGGGEPLAALQLRRRAALVSAAAGGVFRASVEDNVLVAALATGREPEPHEARAACEAAGLGAFVAALPEGYRTVVGDGTGVAWPGYLRLRLALARAIVRRPRLLLVDDADALADALDGGVEALAALLRRAAAAAGDGGDRAGGDDDDGDASDSGSNSGGGGSGGGGCAVVVTARSGSGARVGEQLAALLGAAAARRLELRDGTLVAVAAGGGTAVAVAGS